MKKTTPGLRAATFTTGIFLLLGILMSIGCTPTLVGSPQGSGSQVDDSNSRNLRSLRFPDEFDFGITGAFSLELQQFFRYANMDRAYSLSLDGRRLLVSQGEAFNPSNPLIAHIAIDSVMYQISSVAGYRVTVAGAINNSGQMAALLLDQQSRLLAAKLELDLDQGTLSHVLFPNIVANTTFDSVEPVDINDNGTMLARLRTMDNSEIRIARWNSNSQDPPEAFPAEFIGARAIGSNGAILAHDAQNRWSYGIPINMTSLPQADGLDLSDPKLGPRGYVIGRTVTSPADTKMKIYVWSVGTGLQFWQEMDRGQVDQINSQNIALIGGRYLIREEHQIDLLAVLSSRARDAVNYYITRISDISRDGTMRIAGVMRLADGSDEAFLAKFKVL